MSDDERIAAYVDGRLSEAERAAFEARLAREADLQRKVTATQLLLREAPSLRVNTVPRNFILPVGSAAHSRRAQATRPWALRLAAAFAAVLFVSLLVIDQTLPPLGAPPLPTPPAAAEPMLEAAPAGEPAAPRMMPQMLPADSAALPTPTALAPMPPTMPQPAPPPAPQPLITPLRVLAGLALIAAVALGWLSRARR